MRRYDAHLPRDRDRAFHHDADRDQDTATAVTCNTAGPVTPIRACAAAVTPIRTRVAALAVGDSDEIACMGLGGLYFNRNRHFEHRRDVHDVGVCTLATRTHQRQKMTCVCVCVVTGALPFF